MFYKFEKCSNPRVDWQYIYKQDFNDEFCDALINSCEEDKWSDAKVGGKPGDKGVGRTDKKIRSVMHQPLKMGNYKGMGTFPYYLLADRIWRANSEVWRLDIDGFNLETDGPNILRYKVEEGGHYDWHLDYGAEFSNRKISFILQLSSPNDYDGCNLELMGCPPDPKMRERGTLIMFPSYIRHRITHITRGMRYCVVGWIHGPHFR